MTEEEKIGMISKYTDKGFGFLENGLFFHISQIPEEIHAFLEEGLMVNYTEVQGEKGPVAKISSTVDGLESAEVEAPKFSGEYVIIDPQKILFEDTIQHIETIIELDGAVLIPGILRRFPNSFGRIKKNQEFDVVDKIETHLKEAFDNLSVSKYDLFRPKNKTDGTSITGHPYLQETSPFTWLIRKKSVNVNFNPRKKIPDALLQFIYSHIIEQDEDCWVIVGDETGDLGEF
ncbi:MAG TPA: cold shock domain-containing protein, partial [Candidatus Poseidoniales archaeon]